MKQCYDAAHRGRDGLGYSQKATEGKYVPTSPRKTKEAGPYDPVPKKWTPEHVLRRIIEAFQIDRRLLKVGPNRLRCSHPTICHTPEEIEAWEKIPINPNSGLPSLEETIKMEKAFDWLIHVAQIDFDAFYALKRWTMCKAGKMSIRQTCKQIGVHPRTLPYRMDRALDKIVGDIRFAPVW